MEAVFGAAVAAFGLVFLAELGDKTQLLAVNYGSQHPTRLVVAGLALGYGAASLVAVVIGGVLGANLPQRPIEIVGGLVFIGFGLRALRSGGGDGDSGPSIVTTSVVATIGLTILVAEMGDKTQIATATLAARSDPVGTWIGATAGEVFAGSIGVVAGRLVGDRIPDVLVSRISAGLFIVFGSAMLVGWP